MRRDPRSARLLGLWTAICLAVLLVVGLCWVGDITLQWPVLLVPVLWAAVALRPRRRRPAWEVVDRPGLRSEPFLEARPYGERTDTVERHAVRGDEWR